MTTERSRRSILKATMLGGAVTGGALLLPAGQALAADDPDGHGWHCGCPGPNPSPTPTPVPPGGPGSGPLAFALTVVNESGVFTPFCVYQSSSAQQASDVMSLAWFTQSAPPSSSVRFDWKTDYNFVWGAGPLAPGAVFRPGEVWPADPTVPARQQVVFDYVGARYLFRQGQFVADPQPGSLYIRESSGLPLGQAAVGIGMFGAATYVTPAGPNVELVFEPRPSYFIAAGQFVPGEVLDVEQISGQSALVEFAPGVYEMTAKLNRDSTWSVYPTFVG